MLAHVFRRSFAPEDESMHSRIHMEMTSEKMYPEFNIESIDVIRSVSGFSVPFANLFLVLLRNKENTKLYRILKE